MSFLTCFKDTDKIHMASGGGDQNIDWCWDTVHLHRLPYRLETNLVHTWLERQPILSGKNERDRKHATNLSEELAVICKGGVRSRASGRQQTDEMDC